jgi:uncharacterized protein YggE
MGAMRMRFYVLLIVTGLNGSSLNAQRHSVTPSHISTTQIRTTATATRSIPPDLAIAQFEFFARDSTLNEAARGAAAIGEAIRRAVVKAGVPGDSVLGRGSVAFPWDQATLMEVKMNSEFRRYDTTYVFRDMVLVRIRDLKRVGPVLDAALAAGAQKLASLQFSSSRVQQASQDALAEATRQARRNAELMAEAGGGRIGRPLELTTENSGSGESFYDLRPTNSTCTSGNYCGLRARPPDAEVRVSVYGRWELVPASDSVPR